MIFIQYIIIFLVFYTSNISTKEDDGCLRRLF